MKAKFFSLVTAVLISAGGAIYGFNSSQSECPLKGTQECPLVQECPLYGTPECPKVVAEVKLKVSDCCKKK